MLKIKDCATMRFIIGRDPHFIRFDVIERAVGSLVLSSHLADPHPIRFLRIPNYRHSKLHTFINLKIIRKIILYYIAGTVSP